MCCSFYHCLFLYFLEVSSWHTEEMGGEVSYFEERSFVWVCHGQFDLWSATACANQCRLFWQFELHHALLFFRNFLQLRVKVRLKKLRLWQIKLPATQCLANNDTVHVHTQARQLPNDFLVYNLKNTGFVYLCQTSFVLSLLSQGAKCKLLPCCSDSYLYKTWETIYDI